MSKRNAIIKGSGVLLLSLAYGCANTPGGTTNIASGPQVSGAGLISNSAGGLISNNAGGLISNNAGGLISNNAGGLISNNAGGLISNNAGGLISNNAGGLSGAIKGPAAGLISNNAGGLISNNAGGLISNNAGGLISNNAGGLISNNAGGLISNNAGGYRIAATAANSNVGAGANVAVFNERGEMISYSWVVSDKDGNYSFKRLKPSGPLLFIKAVKQVGDRQVVLSAAARAPGLTGNATAINVTPATTLVAKKIQEMVRLRVVSVATVKAETCTSLAAKIETVLTPAAGVLAILQNNAAAAKTFDLAMVEVKAEIPALSKEIAVAAAAAPSVLNTTPVDTGVDTANSPSQDPGFNNNGSNGNTIPPVVTTPDETTPDDPTVTPPGGSPTTSTLKASVISIEGLSITSADALGAALGSNKVYLPNGGSPKSLTATSLTEASPADETVEGTVKAVAFAGTERYYLTDNTIVKPDNSSITLTGVTGPTDFAIAGNFAYITSSTRHVIYKVDLTSGAGTVLAGVDSSRGATNGSGATALFHEPRGITYDSATSALLVADTTNRKIRKVTLAGAVSDLAGSGVLGASDGAATVAGFKAPFDVTVDDTGNLYVMDSGANKVRKVVIATGEVSTIAGSGTQASADGTGGAASFAFAYSLAYGKVAGKPVIWVGEGTKVRVVQNW